MFIYTIALLIAIVASAIVTYGVMKRCNKTEHSVAVASENTELDRCSDSALSDLTVATNLEDIDELLIEDILGEDLIFKRPNMAEDKEYKEIVLDRNGMIIQNTGQAMITANQTTYTLSQLNKIAPNGLFTGSVPVSDISIYKNGLASSVKYSSKGVITHNGFVPLESSQIAHVSPMAITAVTMQGAAIITGQYHLVQLKRELEKNTQGIEELKDLHEKEVIGKLLYCQSKLLEIVRRQNCDLSDLSEIGNCARDAGQIFHEYKLRHEDARKAKEDYYFDGVHSDRAISKFNELVSKERYLQKVCLFADRITKEAKIVEYATRCKMDINDSKIRELYRELWEDAQNGYSSQVGESIEEECDHIKRKASKILEQGYSGIWPWKQLGEQEKLMTPIYQTVEGIISDFDAIALENYGQRIDKQSKDVLLMIDEKTGETKLFEVA